MQFRRYLLIPVFLIFHFITNSQALQWAKPIGGAQSDVANKSTIDVNGNLYVTGSIQGPNVDLDPGLGIFNLSSAGLKDGYVAKYDKNGNFKWAFKIGGSSQDEINDVALDHSGNIIITGYFRGGGVDFDPSAATALLTSNGESGGDPGYGGDMFLAKYDTLGIYKWALNCGGKELGDNGTSVSADNNDNVLVTGYFRDTVDFDPSISIAKLIAAQGTLFVAKYSSAGQYQWAFNAGQGNIDNTGFKVLADNQNNVVVTGFFQGSNIDFDPGPGIASLSSSGSFEFFVAKYDVTGNYLWAKRAGGSGTDVGRSLTIDALNDIYVTGDYNSSSINFNTGQPANLLTNHGSNDLFLVKYSSTGEHLWSFSVGGNSVEVGSSVSRDDVGNILITGGFSGVNVDFDPSINTIALTSQGGYDIYSVKYDPAGNYVCSFRVGGAGDDIGNCVSSYGNFYYYTGQFHGTGVDFDPLTTATLLNGSGVDGFIAKYDWTVVQPNGTITGDYSCLANQAQLTFTSITGTAPFTLYINNGSTTTTYTNLQSHVPFTLSPTPSTTTIYTLTGIRDATFCAGMTPTNLPVTIVPMGVHIITSGNTSVCKMDSVQLSASGGITYQWIPNTGLSNASIANPKAAPASTTTYKVIVTNAVGCKDSATLTVTVKPLPVLSVLPTNATYCKGDSLQLIASGGSAYQWSPSIGLSNTSISNPKASPPVTITYKLIVRSADGCIDSLNKTVVKNLSPIIALSPSAPICPGDSLQLNATGGTTYQWTPSIGLNNSNISNPKGSPAATTIYQAITTNAEGCKDSASTTISVKTKPVINISQPTAVCKGDSVQLNASGGISYLWRPSLNMNDATISNPKASPLLTTTYTVVVTGTNACIDSSTIVAIINQPPSIVITANSSVCAGDSMQLNAGGGAVYQWSPAIGLSSTNSATPKASPAITITYKVLVYTAANCLDSAFVTIAVKPKPVVTVTPSSILCKGDTAQLNASGGVSYQWFPSTGLSNSTIASPLSFTDSSINYKVLVNNIEGCKDSAETSVTIFQKPQPFIGRDTAICIAEDLVLIATMPSGSNYVWSTGAITQNITVSQPGTYSVLVKINGCNSPATDTMIVSNLPLPTVALRKDTTICSFYTLRIDASGTDIADYLWNTGSTDSFILVNNEGIYNVDVRNKCGSVSDAITIAVDLCADDLFFPTGFTPNGDRRNDIFKAVYLQGLQVLDYELQVFNRWGERIFTTKDVNKGWDGRINGKEQGNAVFVWLAKYKKTGSSTLIVRKGTTALIR